MIVATLFATESVTFAPAARARSVVSTSGGVFVETCVGFRWKMSFTLTLSMRRLGVLLSGLKKVPQVWTCTSPVLVMTSLGVFTSPPREPMTKLRGSDQRP